MLVHGHRFVRAQMLLKNADPLVFQLQVGVLRIGYQGIGRLFRGAGLLRPGGSGCGASKKIFAHSSKEFCYVDVA